MSAKPRPAAPIADDDEAAAAIDQSFSFLRKAHDNPSLLDDYPAEGTIVFREADIDGHRFALSAVRAEGATEWVARPFRYTMTAGARVFQRPIVDERGQLPDQVVVRPHVRRAGERLHHSGIDARVVHRLQQIRPRLIGVEDVALPDVSMGIDDQRNTPPARSGTGSSSAASDCCVNRSA